MIPSKLQVVKNYFTKTGRRTSFTALAIYVVSLAFFGYVNLLDSPPQSTHLWRQSDCVSLALNYFHDKNNFFEPQIHNLQANQGTTGHAISELPILYYGVAGLFHIFGPHYWVYRSLWIVILLLGFHSLFWLIKHFTGRSLLAFMGAYIVFTSPLLVFYGINFMPDVPALVMTIVGWMFFAKWLATDHYKYLYLTALFFLLGGLLKVTAFISLVSLAAIWFLELFGAKFGKRGLAIFKKPWQALIPFAVALTLALAWYTWAWSYNKLHSSQYFSMYIYPIWEVNTLAENGVSYILTQIRLLWVKHLFATPTYLFLIGCIGVIAAYRKYANRFLLGITILSFIGTILYMSIWFMAFDEHDYYFINLYIFPIFLLITALDIIKTRFDKFYSKGYLIITLALVALWGSYHTFRMQRVRYKGWMNEYPAKFADIKSVAPHLSELGIKPNDYVISLPDATPNYTLHLLNRKGWTLHFLNRNGLDDTFGHGGDSLAIARCIANGAKFMFVSDFENTISERKYITHFTHSCIGKYNNLRIFRLDSIKHSRYLMQHSDTIMHITCNAERIDKRNPKRLETNTNGIGCKGATLRDSSASLSGKFSITVSKNKPYGFTTSIPCPAGTLITAKAWRKANGSNGSLVIAGKGSSSIYHTESRGTDLARNGWEEIVLKASIGDGCKTEELSVYVWNPNETPSNFDDFEIIVEKKSIRMEDPSITSEGKK